MGVESLAQPRLRRNNCTFFGKGYQQPFIMHFSSVCASVNLFVVCLNLFFCLFQTGNIFAIVCGCCQRLIEPNLPKKSKKRPQIQTQNEQLIALDKIIQNAGEQLQTLQDFFKQFENDNIKSLTEHFIKLTKVNFLHLLQ